MAAQLLEAEGVDIRTICYVADDLTEIETALELMSNNCDLIVLSGGMAHSDQDATRRAVSALTARSPWRPSPPEPPRSNVITSVGSPAPVVERVRAYGGRVLADVATVRHARKAIAAGVDVLVLLTAGAGGNTGWLNPFAFVEEVRGFWSGPLAVAGGITTGRQVRAVQVAGADLAYVGTPFIATHESLAAEAYKQALCGAGADDIVLTDAVTGIPANFLASSLRDNGIMSADGRLAPRGSSDMASWKTAWSAGHGVASVREISSVAQRVEALREQWLASR
jgi:nitronate monooxygenase